MKIIFLKDISGAGRKGEVKDVSEGYANNFLLPKGYARVVTPQLQVRLSKEAKEAEIKKSKEIEKLQALKSEVEKRTFIIKVKVGDKGQIFGGVHEKDMAKVIGDKMNITLEKHQIGSAGPVKALGIHPVTLALGNGIIASVKILVEAES